MYSWNSGTISLSSGSLVFWQFRGSRALARMLLAEWAEHGFPPRLLKAAGWKRRPLEGKGVAGA